MIGTRKVETQRFDVVCTASGKAFTPTGAHPKARGWLMLDGTFVLCTPSQHSGQDVDRRIYDNILSSVWSEQRKTLVINLTDGTTVSMDANGCGCGMGAVGNAGPIEGGYAFNRVDAPPWHTNI